VFGMIGNATSNINTLRAQQQAFQFNSLRRAQLFAQLSSPLRINRASDDPVGLIASQSLGRTLAALDTETSTNERASAQANTADGALGQISDLLVQAKSLVTANANTGGLSADEKSANQLQIDSILSTVNRLSSTTSFGGQKMLDGTATLKASGKSFAIPSAATTNLGTTNIGGTTYTLSDLTTGKPLNTLGTNGASAGTVIDQAINDISTQRANLGAFDRNTLEPRIDAIATSRAQLLSAVSSLQDTDFTLAAIQQSHDQVLQTSSLASLLQGIGHRRISTFSFFA
jgi:flagellin